MSGRKRILVVDDEVTFRSILKIILGRHFDVTTASDGAQAWKILQEESYDLLLADCQMPMMDGLTLCRLVRTYEPTRNLRIILVTAKCFEFDRSAVEQEIFPGTIFAKPFSPRQLLVAVDRCLNWTPDAIHAEPCGWPE